MALPREVDGGEVVLAPEKAGGQFALPSEMGGADVAQPRDVERLGDAEVQRDEEEKGASCDHRIVVGWSELERGVEGPRLEGHDPESAA